MSRSRFVLAACALLASLAAAPAGAEDAALADKLKGLDTYMEEVVKEWNVPGIGLGIVAGDELVFAKGYGYRDYGKKLPFTPKTTVPIASNTKLFTAVAVGLLVEEGKLDWDRPVREFVPAIEFFNDELNASVTIRDMLAHRTGVTRHDTIWYKSDFTRKELYERLLGMSETPWIARGLDIRLKAKEAGKEARAKAGGGQVAGTKPSHALEDYAGEFEDKAYGTIAISMKDGGLFFDFHQIRLPLSHFHYDRFDTPDDEQNGKWSVNFSTSPQGEVDKALLSLDQAEVTFVRRVPAELSTVSTLRPYAGTYETSTGAKFEVVLKEDGVLGLVFPGQPFQALVPWKPRQFRIAEFSDYVFEFVVVDSRVTELKQIVPSGEFRFFRSR
jgi:hypothetical protein